MHDAAAMCMSQLSCRCVRCWCVLQAPCCRSLILVVHIHAECHSAACCTVVPDMFQRLYMCIMAALCSLPQLIYVGCCLDGLMYAVGGCNSISPAIAEIERCQAQITYSNVTVYMCHQACPKRDDQS